MTTTTFIDQQTPIVASWLNDVNALTYGAPQSTGSGLVGYTQGSAGSVARTAQQKMREIISVKDFGAVGDGTTDDTAAINAAMAAAYNSGGGVVQFLAGNYKITSSLTIPTNVSFMGQCGAPAFVELSTVHVTRIVWGGAVGGTMCNTVAVWTGRIDNIMFDANGVAGICFNPYSMTGCVLTNVHWVKSLYYGVRWQTISAYPSGLNTLINCISSDHGSVGFDMQGLSNAAVTLNTFIGCRFSGSIINLRLLEYADTNMFYGGRIEGGTSYGLIINDPSGGFNVDSCMFYGVTMDGTGAGGSTMCYIAKSLASPPAGGGNTVALFHGCHFTSSAIFNGAPAGANIIVQHCPNFAQMYSSNGDNVPCQLITAGASPYTYTNADPYTNQVVIGGGTISGIAIVRGGTSQATGLTNGSFILHPGDQITVTYTVVPNVFMRYQI